MKPLQSSAIALALAMSPLATIAQYRVEILSSEKMGGYTEVKAKIPWEEGHNATLELRVFCDKRRVYLRDYKGSWSLSPLDSVNAFVMATECK